MAWNQDGAIRLVCVRSGAPGAVERIAVGSALRSVRAMASDGGAVALAWTQEAGIGVESYFQRIRCGE